MASIFGNITISSNRENFKNFLCVQVPTYWVLEIPVQGPEPEVLDI